MALKNALRRMFRFLTPSPSHGYRSRARRPRSGPLTLEQLETRLTPATHVWSALGSTQNPMPLFLDNVLQASTVVTAHLLPGPHTFATYGGDFQFFDIDPAGAISLRNGALGTVSGNSLTITGIAVQIDATALGVGTLFVDGVGLDATAPFPINLLPGRHTFATAASTAAHFFDIAPGGTFSLVNPLDGSVMGNLLTITQAG